VIALALEGAAGDVEVLALLLDDRTQLRALRLQRLNCTPSAPGVCAVHPAAAFVAG
jgi:hypothetical protein